MPTHLPVRLSLLEGHSRLSWRGLTALMLWAFALLAFTLPTQAYHGGDISYVEVSP